MLLYRSVFSFVHYSVYRHTKRSVRAYVEELILDWLYSVYLKKRRWFSFRYGLDLRLCKKGKCMHMQTKIIYHTNLFTVYIFEVFEWLHLLMHFYCSKWFIRTFFSAKCFLQMRKEVQLAIISHNFCKILWITVCLYIYNLIVQMKFLL